eukprot:5015934-Alexandrium_andersonii.AAC.1
MWSGIGMTDDDLGSPNKHSPWLPWVPPRARGSRVPWSLRGPEGARERLWSPLKAQRSLWVLPRGL